MVLAGPNASTGSYARPSADLCRSVASRLWVLFPFVVIVARSLMWEKRGERGRRMDALAAASALA